MIDNKDKVGAALLLVFALFYFRYSFDIPADPTAVGEFFTPRTLPTGLAILTIICSLVQLFMPANDSENLSIRDAVAGYQWKPMILLTSLMVVYSLSFSFLGFILATLLFLCIGFIILGEKRLMLCFSIAAGLVLFMWGMLTQLFGLYLDDGSLYRIILEAL
ncbi:MAG: tripartite tricarboxylate transporter TctB family protein [Oceanicoccus sp.]|nr:tripartite tricarboxylate transporter TctB family protein [Oceanicoccus sp.]MDG1773582.1 tripartite tricarboxylate transporter TctB family protein [Oceanicoccus sp.]